MVITYDEAQETFVKDTEEARQVGQQARTPRPCDLGEERKAPSSVYHG